MERIRHEKVGKKEVSSETGKMMHRCILHSAETVDVFLKAEEQPTVFSRSAVFVMGEVRRG